MASEWANEIAWSIFSDPMSGFMEPGQELLNRIAAQLDVARNAPSAAVREVVEAWRAALNRKEFVPMTMALPQRLAAALDRLAKEVNP